MKLTNREAWVYSIRVGLNQDVTIDRNKAQCIAETWHDGMIGFAPTPELVSSFRKSLGSEGTSEGRDH